MAKIASLSEGPLENTSNPLDVALNGEGYFTIQTDRGDAYSRNGHFELDSQGQLVNQRGEPVLSDDGQPFVFTPEDNNITIGRDGTISTDNGAIGRLAVVTFENPQTLSPGAAGQYFTDETPVPVESPIMVQGMLEGSNVRPVIEIAKMIQLQRTYESVRGFLEKEDSRIKGMVQAYSQV